MGHAQPQPALLSGKDVEAIQSISDRFVGLFLSRDFDGLMELYTTGAKLMPPHGPTVTGREAIKEFMATFPPVTTFETTVEEIDGRVDLAYVTGTYSLTMEPPGAPPIQDRGKYVEIRRRQRDGTWPLAVDIFNSDLEPA